jgi:glutamate--cysteine ligase regulatory subunit
MNGGPSVIRRPTIAKSNVELVNGLRANFLMAQQSEGLQLNGSAEGKDTKHLKYNLWTSREGDTLYVPATEFAQPGLAEERSSYDITVKLFYLPGIPSSRRCTHTKEAISLVLKELNVESIDLLILSFPGISFDAEDDEEISDSESEADELETVIKTWRTLETLHSEGRVTQLGVAEFGSERLEKFLPQTKVRPSVDQINVKDCCVVPKSLILYAKKENIELLTHNDCTDILPRGTTRELLGSGEKGAGILADDENEGLEGDIEPQWVIKYTAVVKDRGVIENKGYFAEAQVGVCIPER